jgi:hypothetical protein
MVEHFYQEFPPPDTPAPSDPADATPAFPAEPATTFPGSPL